MRPYHSCGLMYLRALADGGRHLMTDYFAHGQAAHLRHLDLRPEQGRLRDIGARHPQPGAILSLSTDFNLNVLKDIYGYTYFLARLDTY